MPSIKKERRTVNDSSVIPSQSRKSSISVSEHTFNSTGRRRSSNPHILPVPSSSFHHTSKRSPLAPLDPQSQSDYLQKDYADMSGEDDRKPSITLTNATRPTPYVHLKSSRRPHSSYQQVRRTSLPALNLPADIPTSSSFNDITPTHDEDIYSNLSTFTFGNASNISTAWRGDDGDAISPLQRLSNHDITPRPSLVPDNQHRKHSKTWESVSSSDEDEKRRTTRSKMRAIDDGSRRPSLPTNEDDVNYHSRRPSQSLVSSSDHEVNSDMNDIGESSRKWEKSANREVEAAARERMYNDLDTDVDLMPDHDTESDDDHLMRQVGRSWVDSQHRRGSLPMSIPAPSASSYGADTLDMYTIDAMRRPSRSLNDDMSNFNHPGSRRGSTARAISTHNHISADGVGPSSEPDMRGLALAHAHIQAQQEAFRASAEWRHESGSQNFASQNQTSTQPESAYQGFDLNFIYQGLVPSAGTESAHNPSPFDADWNEPYNNTTTKQSGLPSTTRERENSWSVFWKTGIISGRRPSTATVGTLGDDTFLKNVKQLDPLYETRRREWSFVREQAAKPLTPNNTPRGNSEIWRCDWVGRFRVDRTFSRSTDPDKPPQSRLNIRHLLDHSSKGNRRGGPPTFIHKHSRAQAFSIFRGHALPQRHLKTSESVLLAPKRVQEQFTSTRTTSRLDTHGLLENDDGYRETSYHSRTQHFTISETLMHDADYERRSESHNQAKGKGKRKAEDVEVANNHTTGSGRSNTHDGHLEGMHTEKATHSGKSIGPVTDLGLQVAADRNALYEQQTSRNNVASSSALPISSKNYDDSWNTFPTRHPGYLPSAARTQGSLGSLDDQPLPRTSHAEAFTTLDLASIEYMRQHSSNYDSYQGDQDMPALRFKGLRKLFQAQPAKNAPKHNSPPPGVHSTILEGHYSPPWLTMAARHKQEEQERVIKNLNDSFRDVGLLPSVKPHKPRTKPKLNKKEENILDQIPEDSLYMLVPMWPGETDPMSMMGSENPAMYNVPLYDRQYLLVYYVPFGSKESEEKTKNKKRPRQSQSGSSSSQHSSSHSDHNGTKDNRNHVKLTSFKILARLVSYKDVNGSGVRAPTDGLSVTGPLRDAVESIPQTHFRADDLAPIIGFCDKRERGIEFLPEAAEKLGLCVPRVSHDPDGPDAPLSPIGRAAVELAWAGAMALMGYELS